MDLITPSQLLIDSAVALSKDEETEGFDLQAGTTWTYPTNYPLRDYQFAITQEALLKNTLVSLPTGLGKTFIAAVVMFNFYRWYPQGKVIFMAPTRPLVKQQIDACYNIMAIPKDVTAELTGSKAQTARKDIWREKKVFFITPQVLQNDLDILTQLGKQIKCVVFDEAHKAKGNHAYCQVIRKLTPQNMFFRVLALSATPGNNMNDVLEVVNNLMISHIELRHDSSPDVVPYIFERSLETVVVPLGEQLQKVKQEYTQVLDKHTRFLIQHNVIRGNCSTLTKGKIFMTMREFQERSKNGRDRSHSDIMRNLNICITLYHAYELLIRHGLRGFLSFFQEHIDKPLLRGNTVLQKIVADVAHHLGPTPNVEPLPDGTVPEVPQETRFGHPKFYKLGEILSDHFQAIDEAESRVIVFCEYKESVMEAYAHLLQLRPRVKPRIFLGQGSISQKQQIRVVKAFRDGECNTLISTCIGEEGLDVGDVDLIVCFDISNKSPVRMVQRMGRTGRKRRGRVVMLVTEGKEQQILQECLVEKNNLNVYVSKSGDLEHGMYPNCPRMIPEGVDPKCQKMFITVAADVIKVPKKKRNNIVDLFNGMTATQKTFEQKIVDKCDRIPESEELWNKSVKNIKDIVARVRNVDYSKQTHSFWRLQSTGVIGHSKESEDLVKLLEFAESKRFNLPISQVPEVRTQLSQFNFVKPKSRKISQTNSASLFKQTDIRSLFQKTKSKSDIRDDEIIEIIADEADSVAPSIDFNDLLIAPSKCGICASLFNCNEFKSKTADLSQSQWIMPNLSAIQNIDEELLTKFNESLLFHEKIVDLEEHHFDATWNKGENIQSIVDAEFIENFFGMEESELYEFRESLLQQKGNEREGECAVSIQKNLVPAKDEEKNFVESDEDLFDDTELNRNIVVEIHENQQKDENMECIDEFFHHNEFEENITEANCANNATINKAESIADLMLPSVDDFNESKLNQSSFQACSTISNVLNKCGLTASETEAAHTSGDLFDESLNFFGLNNLAEIFSAPQPQTPTKSVEENEPNIDTSPIICSFDRSIRLKNKMRRKLFESRSPNESEDLFSDSSFTALKPNLSVLKSPVKTPSYSEKPETVETDVKAVEDNTKKITHEDLLNDTFFDFTFDIPAMTKKRKSDTATTNVSPVIDSKTKNNGSLSSLTPSNSLLSITQIIDLVNTTKKQRIPKKSPLSMKRTTAEEEEEEPDLNESFNFIHSSAEKRIRTPIKSNHTKYPPLNSSNNNLNKSQNSSLNISNSGNNESSEKENDLNVRNAFDKNSDDEFKAPEQFSRFIKPKSPRLAKNKKLSLSRKKRVKKKQSGVDFLDLEAQISSDEAIEISDDECEESDDHFDASFVDDATQATGNLTMQAQYLQSVRSPVLQRGKFKIPVLTRDHLHMNVFSQPVRDDSENVYLHDSFCVNEEIEPTQNMELSELEVAEMILERNRQNRKKVRKKADDGPSCKRRRIFVISSDSE